MSSYSCFWRAWKGNIQEEGCKEGREGGRKYGGRGGKEENQGREQGKGIQGKRGEAREPREGARIMKVTGER